MTVNSVPGSTRYIVSTRMAAIACKRRQAFALAMPHPHSVIFRRFHRRVFRGFLAWHAHDAASVSPSSRLMIRTPCVLRPMMLMSPAGDPLDLAAGGHHQQFVVVA